MELVPMDKQMTRLTSRHLAVVLVVALSTGPVGWSAAHGQDHPAHGAPAAPENAAHLAVSPPLAGPLSRGLAVITFRTENLKVMPVYGDAATQVVPRLGHLHVTVDGGPWHWLHASDEPIVVQGLPPGPHRVLLELAAANHRILETQTLNFEIPLTGGDAPK
jgi:hypothetical protein